MNDEIKKFNSLYFEDFQIKKIEDGLFVLKSVESITDSYPMKIVNLINENLYLKNNIEELIIVKLINSHRNFYGCYFKFKDYKLRIKMSNKDDYIVEIKEGKKWIQIYLDQNRVGEFFKDNIDTLKKIKDILFDEIANNSSERIYLLLNEKGRK